MKTLEMLGLRRTCDWLSPSSQSFRPPSWPPPEDWTVSEDQTGKVLSRWGDALWDISPWAGRRMILDFGDDCINANYKSGRRAKSLDPANARLLRIITTWRMWGIKSCINANSLKAIFHIIRDLISICSENNILASDLPRHPKIQEKIQESLTARKLDVAILELHRLWDNREHIGFFIADLTTIKRLSTTRRTHETEQTAYIPPRIWTYQNERLRECIDDYLLHQEEIENCFNFCLDAYVANAGSLEDAVTKHLPHKPFSFEKHPKNTKSTHIYYGRFDTTAKRFGIFDLISRWISVSPKGMKIKSFSAYFSLVQIVCTIYIANFTLQRRNEAGSLRTDCLIWETDEKLGRIPIICGETTKTEQDSDARWPTSPSVEFAVKASTSIAKLRMRCIAANPATQVKKYDIENPYIFDRASEPWGSNKNLFQSYSTRVHITDYKSLCGRFKLLFDNDKLRITEEDLRIAKMLTPNLNEEFSAGCIWRLSWHQLRRTSAVNMFASGLISNPTLQFLMKHVSRLMPLYYGSGYSKLLLNEEVAAVITSTMYEVLANKLQLAFNKNFVSPYGEEHKDAIFINLITGKDIKSLTAAARRGQVYLRETIVGACTFRGTCLYGGIESVSPCTGGDGNPPCPDALYDRSKAVAIEREIEEINQELPIIASDSPKYKSLLAERQGMENFLNVVKK
ncbi:MULTISPECIES: hypothetical protein [Pseudomonas]|uniref:Integrase n=2 Tax=Pseudomonas TaxID=286 RepID=A0AB35WWA0_9PSED|nr:MULTISPECIES: hypothetical protein [Pseudomonas]MDO1434407.1 hypothetical protein [Pseudomonas aeruginosa]MEE1867609.1 hypothetical protein [Pseudomonas sp. 120P]MEE1958436.1 hypothetical protein [Pseudomonas sp. 119P]